IGSLLLYDALGANLLTIRPLRFHFYTSSLTDRVGWDKAHVSRWCESAVQRQALADERITVLAGPPRLRFWRSCGRSVCLLVPISLSSGSRSGGSMTPSGASTGPRLTLVAEVALSFAALFRCSVPALA